MAKQIFIDLRDEINEKIRLAIEKIDALEGNNQECNKTNPLPAKKRRMGKKKCKKCGTREPFALLQRHYFYKHSSQEQKNRVMANTNKKGQYGTLLFQMYPELLKMSKLA